MSYQNFYSVILYIYHVETLAFIVISPGLNVFTLPEREVSLVWPRSKWAVYGPQCKMSFNVLGLYSDALQTRLVEQ